MPQNSGLVQVDELSAHATWENNECLVIRFDPKKMTAEQLKLLQHVRSKSERVAVKLPPARELAQGHVVGFDQTEHSLFVSLTGGP
jgi:hypothetical protein